MTRSEWIELVVIAALAPVCWLGILSGASDNNVDGIRDQGFGNFVEPFRFAAREGSFESHCAVEEHKAQIRPPLSAPAQECWIGTGVYYSRNSKYFAPEKIRSISVSDALDIIYYCSMLV